MSYGVSLWALSVNTGVLLVSNIEVTVFSSLAPVHGAPTSRGENGNGVVGPTHARQGFARHRFLHMRADLTYFDFDSPKL